MFHLLLLLSLPNSLLLKEATCQHNYYNTQVVNSIEWIILVDKDRKTVIRHKMCFAVLYVFVIEPVVKASWSILYLTEMWEEK